MIYRGFKLERVIYHANAGTVEFGDGDCLLQIKPSTRVEFVLSERILGTHWQDIASADSEELAKEMIDCVVAARQSFGNAKHTAA